MSEWINERDVCMGWTPFLAACASANTKCLCVRFSPFSQPFFLRRSGLSSSHVFFLQILIDNGAELDVIDILGRSGPFLVALRGNPNAEKCMRELMQQGASLSLSDNKEGWSVFHAAAFGRSPLSLSLFLRTPSLNLEFSRYFAEALKSVEFC